MRKSLNRIAAGAMSLAMAGSFLLAVSPVHADAATTIRDVMTREAESFNSSHTLTFTLAGTHSGDITIDYGANFGGNATFVSGSCDGVGATVSNNGTTGNTVKVTLASCAAGTVTITYTLTNPTGAEGSFPVTMGPDPSGAWSVPITSNDQITINAQLNAGITFEVYAFKNDTCGNANTFDVSGNPIDNTSTDVFGVGQDNATNTVVNLGLMKPNRPVNSSDGTDDQGALIEHICTWVSSNVPHTLSVHSQFGALRSQSVTGDTIPTSPQTGASSISTAGAGIESYGLCLDTDATSTPKLDTTTPLGTAAVGDSPFAPPTCNATSLVGGKLTTGTNQIAHDTGHVQDSAMTWLVKASVSGTTPAHQDYQDVLTFIATGTF